MRMLASLAAVAAGVLALSAAAQEPPARVRGTIQSFDGGTLVVATADRGAVRLAVGEQTGINGLEARTVADIRDNAFIGTTAVKNAAGRWQATEVHIFPESMRGAGEGHYAWDLPDSSMTNAAVTGVAAAGRGRGRTLKLQYAGGAVDVDVTRRTKIVALTAGDRALLKPGAAVLALVVPQQGGGAAAVAVIAETNGVKPPM